MNKTEDILTAPEAATSPAISVLGSRGVREFVRYFIASAAALAMDIGTLYLLTDVFGVPYLYSGAGAFMLGLAVVYILSISWVFERRLVKNVAAEFFFFALIGLVGLALNEGVLYVLTGVLGFFYLFSKIASVAVVFTWNFFARKYMLFRA